MASMQGCVQMSPPQMQSKVLFVQHQLALPIQALAPLAKPSGRAPWTQVVQSQALRPLSTHHLVGRGSMIRVCSAASPSPIGDAISAPRFNPQNTDNALIGPSSEQDAAQAVTVQLDALRLNDTPWWNHGVQTAYEYGYDFGSMEPSYYFGSRKDVYHQDHVAGQFRNSYPELVNLASFTITEVRDLGDGERAMVEASVVAGGGAGEERQLSFTFCMRRGVLGRKKGAWLTKMLVRGDIAAAEAQIARLQRGQSP